MWNVTAQTFIKNLTPATFNQFQISSPKPSAFKPICMCTSQTYGFYRFSVCRAPVPA